jgi:cytochrome c553
MKVTEVLRLGLAAAALSFAAGTALADDPPKAAGPKIDLAKGQAIASGPCAACHTIDGSRGLPANPILVGQHPEYLFKQLKDFKAGARQNAIMQGMVAALSEDDMRNVAWFYASKKAPLGTARDAAAVQLGERIYRGGIADRQIPACAGCHSPNGAGIPSQYPRLAGQHAEYTEAQLIAYRAGQRKNNPMMPLIAAKMNDREIKAVSDYIAGLR